MMYTWCWWCIHGAHWDDDDVYPMTMMHALCSVKVEHNYLFSNCVWWGVQWCTWAMYGSEMTFWYIGMIWKWSKWRGYQQQIHILVFLLFLHLVIFEKCDDALLCTMMYTWWWWCIHDAHWDDDDAYLMMRIHTLWQWCIPMMMMHDDACLTFSESIA